MAHQALRVLAGAYKIIDSIPENLTSEELENDLNLYWFDWDD